MAVFSGNFLIGYNSTGLFWENTTLGLSIALNNPIEHYITPMGLLLPGTEKGHQLLRFLKHYRSNKKKEELIPYLPNQDIRCSSLLFTFTGEIFLVHIEHNSNSKEKDGVFFDLVVIEQSAPKKEWIVQSVSNQQVGIAMTLAAKKTTSYKKLLETYHKVFLSSNHIDKDYTYLSFTALKAKAPEVPEVVRNISIVYDA